jgi:hypothetical protein
MPLLTPATISTTQCADVASLIKAVAEAIASQLTTVDESRHH